MTDQQEFYDALDHGNLVSKNQSNNIIVTALVGRIAEAIDKGEDMEKVKELIKLKNELEK